MRTQHSRHAKSTSSKNNRTDIVGQRRRADTKREGGKQVEGSSQMSLGGLRTVNVSLLRVGAALPHAKVRPDFTSGLLLRRQSSRLIRRCRGAQTRLLLGNTRAPSAIGRYRNYRKTCRQGIHAILLLDRQVTHHPNCNESKESGAIHSSVQANRKGPACSARALSQEAYEEMPDLRQQRQLCVPIELTKLLDTFAASQIVLTLNYCSF